MPAGDLGVRSCIRIGGSKAPKKYWMTNQTLAKTIAVVVTATNRRYSLNGPMSCDMHFFQTPSTAYCRLQPRGKAVREGLAIVAGQALDVPRTSAMVAAVIATRSEAR